MTSNPMANDKIYENNVIDGTPMTISGTINKTLVLLVITVATGAYTWMLALQGFADKTQMLMWIGIIAGFILALITSFKPNHARILAPAYAACEGLFLGGISAYFEMMYKGIVAQAVLGTFAAMFTMLILYRLGVIKATDKFRSTIIAATASIAVIYLINIAMVFIFKNAALSNILWSNGALGIGISIVIIIVASLNFILDFDFIERGVQNFAPKHFEWYGAFTMMVTLVWLYIEMLKLLAKLNSRRS